jgi:hypothetical protein
MARDGAILYSIQPCLQIKGSNGLVLISYSSSVSIVIVLLSMYLPVFNVSFVTKAINSLWLSTSLLMINDEINFSWIL